MDARTAIVALDAREKEAKRAFYIPIWALEITDNDFQTAMFLKQVVFWSQRTDNPDGFYKTYDEWLEESRLNRYRVEKAVKIVNSIAGVELIAVCNKKVNGTPKLHYRLDWQALYSLICERCSIGFVQCEQIRNDDVEQIRFAEGEQMDLSTSEQIQYKESDRDIQTDIQTEIADSSFSSDLPPTTSESPAVEEKEKTIIQFPSSEDELISKFADVLGVNVDGSFKLARDTRVTIIGYLRDIRRADPTLSAADFETYLEYYATQKPSRPRPTGGYVVLGWKQYKDWLETRSNEMYGDFLPGTEDYLQVSRGDWRFIKSLEAGDDFTYTDGRGTERHYIKQPDGTFTRAVEQAS